MEQPSGITVTELNRLIGEALRNEPRIRSVTVTAEISGFKRHLASGHWYFSLKDQDSAIACVMFRQHTLRAALMPKDGDSVTVQGHVEIYSRDGKVQLYVTAIRAAGIGSLYEQFEMLKRQLMAEGLFDPGRKRPLPQVPRKVAVITSASGAALHDILNVSGLRCPGIPLVLVPSGVQGADAGKEIVSALHLAEAVPEVDVIILARGGGSVEDLWCFNEEMVARAIAACPVPVVSGVGHETDFTIADYVADVRASTPSNAAEIVFPDRRELLGRAELIRAGLNRAIMSTLQQKQLRLHQLQSRLWNVSPERVLHQLTDRTHQSRQRLNDCVRYVFQERKTGVDNQREALTRVIELRMRETQHTLSQAGVKLEAISPLKVLNRGYALVYDTLGCVLPNAVSAREQQEMTIRFRDGSVIVQRKDTSDGK